MSSLPNFDKFDESMLKSIEADPVNFESFQIEYKLEFHSDVNELRRDIIAFANGNKEGYLFYGIQDSPIKIIGIEQTKVDAIKTVVNDVLPKKIDPILNPFPIIKPIPLSSGKYVVAIKIVPKKHGIYGIRQEDNPSKPNFLTYEFWVRIDGSKRRLKIDDIEGIILGKGGSAIKRLNVTLHPKAVISPEITKEVIIAIKAVNISPRPITIQEYGIHCEDMKFKVIIRPPITLGDSMKVLDPRKIMAEAMKLAEKPMNSLCDILPMKLEDGDLCSAFIEKKEFQNNINAKGYTFPTKVKAYFDTNEGIFYSDLIEIPEWE
ncbi:hypothetical protein NEF87_000217 [Candidatus Lokiarchaeum ossiferum]|uniref:Schlafen AlbA-2 domain-containing protein n=1 Tax=Candidatus Lokiarchaeum ossiferum TaxID=2951803 RepID=A0ABY6HM17_9ARCH|nr:hypothetical protein NEF87_000217 [Candidatus Lokiarchaeum sp. B-35]